MIPQETIQEIIETARVDEVVGDFVALKKKGANLWGNCPFHNEKTPSFTVSPVKGIYKCFGCGKGGNSVNFIMDHEQMTYPEALRFLANKYHITVPEVEKTAEQIQTDNIRESLFLVSQFAETEFANNLWENQEGKAIGLSYFRQRGFSDAIIEKFKLGYSLEGWTGLTDLAIEKGYSKQALVNTGLTIEKEAKRYDRFRSRVMFPIHNLSGRPIAFGARTLLADTKKTPKYLNSPETDIYHKSKVLYGIYQSKRKIISDDLCYLVEGYTDVISLHQAGIENVVASSGTSLTTEQIKLISRFTKNITILYDGDAAGIKASFRGIDMILKEGMNVRVLLFPDGEDPDSYAKSHSQPEVENYLEENVEDFVSFKSRVLIKDAGNDPIKRAGLINEIADSIAVIPDAIVRTVYIKSSSDQLEVPQDILTDKVNQLRNKGAKQQYRPQDEPPPEFFVPPEFMEETSPTKKTVKNAALLHWEREIMRLLIKFGEKEVHVGESKEGDPHYVLAADYILHDLQKDQLEPIDPECLRIFDEVLLKFQENEIINESYFYNHPDHELSKSVIDLLTKQHSLSQNWKEKHEISVTMEEDNLEKSIKNTMYAYKMKRIDLMVEEKQNELRATDDVEVQITLLAEMQQLREIKKAYAKELGIVIG
ncbi:DNA primase [Flavobacteriales bacterium]|nr:DNA primase [Flavobacteriales bacterium]